MADNETTQPAEPKNARKGASPLKTAIVLLGVLALEGGTIGLTMYLAGGPRQVKAVAADVERVSNKRPVEILVAKGRFLNTRTGRHLLYDTEVYITVPPEHADRIKGILEAMKARTSMKIATIIRKADPSYFREATLATLRREMKAALEALIGPTPEGGSYVKKVLITKCNPYRMDF